jgi:opacity protein-like surface antigen
MRSRRALTFASGMLVLAFAAPARADITAFLGANTTPASRQVRGGALGTGLLIVGFEFEYAYTAEDPTAAAPSLKTGMGNILLQAPFQDFQPYVTSGVGIFNESLGTHSETNFGSNAGGGVKIGLAGPVRLRVDYRIFKLGSGALNSPAHRIYAGLNLKF